MGNKLIVLKQWLHVKPFYCEQKIGIRETISLYANNSNSSNHITVQRMELRENINLCSNYSNT